MPLVESAAPTAPTPANTALEGSYSGYESMLSRQDTLQLSTLHEDSVLSARSARPLDSETTLEAPQATGFNGLFSFEKQGVCIEDYVEIQHRIDEALMPHMKDSACTPIALRLGILGRSLDEAKPHLIIFCNKKQAKKVERFLRKKRTRKMLESDNLRAGPLEVIVCDQAPILRLCAEHVDIHIASSVDRTLHVSTYCGLAIRVYTRGAQEFRKATLGGIIRVTLQDGSSSIYGVTAGHPFEEHQDQRLESGTDSDSDDPTDSESSGTEDRAELTIGETSKAWDFSNFDEYDEVLTPGRTKDPAIRERYWDWALIKLKAWKPNQFQTVDNQWETMTAPRVNHRRTTQRKVVMLSASCGPIPGVLQLMTSKIRIYPGRVSVDTFIFAPYVARAIENGDSGSWVVDAQSREVYGHVVATDCFGGAYVIPLASLFHDIKARLHATAVELPSYYDSLPFAFTEFRAFVHNNQEQGEYGDGNSAKYVLRQKLVEYWTPDMIKGILVKDGNDNVDLETINRLKGKYMLLFSILTYISKASHSALRLIENFVAIGEDDTKIPFHSAPPQALLGSIDGSQMYNDFFAAQWIFCPLILGRESGPGDSVLPERQVLATRGLGSLPEHPTTFDRAGEIRLPVGISDSKKIAVIFRTYSEKAVDAYRHDLHTWSMIKAMKQSTDHILSIIDAFDIDCKAEVRHVLVRESPDLGTLVDVFRQNNPPYQQEDLHAFWNSILALVSTVDILHRENQWALHTRFCDILKPSDILVFRENSIPGDPGYHLKLNMLAGSQFRSGKAHKAMAYRDLGPYYAPELGSDSEEPDDWSVDSWSLGCLVVETASWLIGGERGRQDFHHSREMEISEFPQQVGNQLGDCFHDGRNALNAVANILTLAEKCSRRSDVITPEIVRVFLEGSLTGNPAQRFQAGRLHSFCQRAMRDEVQIRRDSRRSSACKDEVERPPILEPHKSPMEELSGQIGANPTSPPHVPFAHLTSDSGYHSPSHITHKSFAKDSAYYSASGSQGIKSVKVSGGYEQHPHVTLPEVVEWMKKRKANRGFSRPQKLPGQELALNALSGRNIFFLVDNSISMQAHKEEVVDALQALAYLVKEIGHDGIEVYLSNKETPPQQAKNTSSLVKYVRSHFDNTRPELRIGDSLNMIADKALEIWTKRNPILDPVFKNPKARRTSVYILTDGLWDGGYNFKEVQIIIQHLVEEMKKKGLSRTDVALHFIQFGDDNLGKQRLQQLEHDLSHTTYDIVDTRLVTDDVWAMLIGSMATNMDSLVNISPLRGG